MFYHQKATGFHDLFRESDAKRKLQGLSYVNAILLTAVLGLESHITHVTPSGNIVPEFLAYSESPDTITTANPKPFIYPYKKL